MFKLLDGRGYESILVDGYKVLSKRICLFILYRVLLYDGISLFVEISYMKKYWYIL